MPITVDFHYKIRLRKIICRETIKSELKYRNITMKLSHSFKVKNPFKGGEEKIMGGYTSYSRWVPVLLAVFLFFGQVTAATHTQIGIPTRQPIRIIAMRVCGNMRTRSRGNGPSRLVDPAVTRVRRFCMNRRGSLQGVA